MTATPWISITMPGRAKPEMSQEGAARAAVIGEVLAPDGDEAVTVAIVADDDVYGDEAGERALVGG